MRKPEQLLWDAMKRHAPAAMWLQRVENVVGDGMPDVYVGCSGKWVELKVVKRIPVKSTTPLLGRGGMRQSQINWHLKNNSLIGAPESFVLIGLPNGDVILVSGRIAQRVNIMTLGELRSFACADDGWDAVFKELK